MNTDTPDTWQPKFKVGDWVKHEFFLEGRQIVEIKDRLWYRIADTAPGVTFREDALTWTLGPSINGHTLAPGQQWHRVDGWTQEMLPEGKRPLILGDDPGPYEVSQDGIIWNQAPKMFWEFNTLQGTTGFLRTRRPLPAVESICECKAPKELGHDDSCLGINPFLVGPQDPYAELKAAHKDGKVIQWHNETQGWRDHHLPGSYPLWIHPVKDYRIKPEPKSEPVPLEPWEAVKATMAAGPLSVDNLFSFLVDDEKCKAIAAAAINAHFAQLDPKPEPAPQPATDEAPSEEALMTLVLPHIQPMELVVRPWVGIVRSALVAHYEGKLAELQEWKHKAEASSAWEEQARLWEDRHEAASKVRDEWKQRAEKAEEALESLAKRVGEIGLSLGCRSGCGTDEMAGVAKDIRQQLEKAEAHILALQGVKFSDRNYGALKSRLEKAEAELAASQKELVDTQNLVRPNEQDGSWTIFKLDGEVVARVPLDKFPVLAKAIEERNKFGRKGMELEKQIVALRAELATKDKALASLRWIPEPVKPDAFKKAEADAWELNKDNLDTRTQRDDFRAGFTAAWQAAMKEAGK